MKSLIIAVGRWKSGPEKQLFEHFAERSKPPLEVREIEVRKKLPQDVLKRKEAELLLAAVPIGTHIVALDINGKALPSSTLAVRIGKWRDMGIRQIAWLIGGANGHGDSVLEKADFILSFGSQTWPHLLVRAMLAEQLFRAQSILAGHPYHRE